MSLHHALAVIALTAAVPAPDKQPAAEAMANVRAAAEAAMRNDCPAALDAAAKATGSKAFATLPGGMQASVLEMAAICAAVLNRPELAYRTALAATVFPDSTDNVWRIRATLELQQHRDEAAVTTVEALAKGRAKVLAGLKIQWLAQLDTNLNKAGTTAARRRLLAVLASDTYRPDQPGQSNDLFRFRYAQLLHDAGDSVAALAAARRIDDPWVVIDTSLDTHLRVAYPTDPDIRALAIKALAAARATAAEHPDAIAPVLRLAALLRMLGQPRDALAALEVLRPKIEGTAALIDRDEQTVWWWDGVSRAKRLAGDDEGALAAFRAGTALSENGGVNVSQTINLAQSQLTLGRPADAIATLAGLAPGDPTLSPFGAMQMVTTRGCAQTRLGTAAADAIGYARAHAADAPEAFTGLLLCIGDTSGAAASLIGRLKDPDQRTDALRTLSDFDPPLPGTRPDPDAARLLALRNRPDVRAAIAAAGGTRRFNVQDEAY